MDTPSERLRAARIAAGYSSAASAARAFGWSVPSYSHHENGTRGLRPEAAEKYARAFRTTAAWLLFDRGREPIPSNPASESEANTGGYPSKKADIESLSQVDRNFMEALAGSITAALYANVLYELARRSRAGLPTPSDLAFFSDPPLTVAVSMARMLGNVDDAVSARVCVIGAMVEVAKAVPHQTLEFDSLLRDLALSICPTNAGEELGGDEIRGALMDFSQNIASGSAKRRWETAHEISDISSKLSETD